MELNQLEIAIVEQAVSEATADQVRDLSELQLAFVGGGIAELVGC